LAYLASQARIPKIPRLYYIPSPTMNAFTVGGQKDSAIAFTEGLFRHLNEREIVGVLAHEVAHIQNRDTWILSLAGLTGQLTRLMSYFGFFLLLLNTPFLLISGYGIPWLFIAILIGVPWLSLLLQFALSRIREFNADLGAVAYTKDPVGLASALEKINGNIRTWQRLLPRGTSSGSGILQTHPPTRERIRRLLALGEENRAAIPIL
ncbi:MAG: M48 family metalloprotease, partial [SAR324 cluster bacterium]|nr:M48 family metalloprotease [SAR324 cluster bacterium]